MEMRASGYFSLKVKKKVSFVADNILEIVKGEEDHLEALQM